MKNVMSFHQRHKFKDKEALLRKISELRLDILFSDDIVVLFDKVIIGGMEIPNRFVIQPMEGYDSNHDGSPDELAFRPYKRFTAEGSGIIWFEATAVVEGGRSNPRQLFITIKNVRVFEKLVKEARQSAHEAFGTNHHPIYILQLTHSGRFAKPKGGPHPIIAQHNKVLDRALNLGDDYPLSSDQELDRLQDAYVDAARLAAKAGFDGVDIKSGHGFLISELLSSFARQDSKYGGRFENRIIFFWRQQKKSNQRWAAFWSPAGSARSMPYPFHSVLG